MATRRSSSAIARSEGNHFAGPTPRSSNCATPSWRQAAAATLAAVTCCPARACERRSSRHTLSTIAVENTGTIAACMPVPTTLAAAD